MSIKSRLAKLQKAILPAPGTCGVCGGDKHPDYVNVLVIGCPDRECPCQEAADCYDPDLFVIGMYPLSPCCIGCHQHVAIHDIRCKKGYGHMEPEYRWGFGPDTQRPEKGRL